MRLFEASRAQKSFRDVAVEINGTESIVAREGGGSGKSKVRFAKENFGLHQSL